MKIWYFWWLKIWWDIVQNWDGLFLPVEENCQPYWNFLFLDVYDTYFLYFFIKFWIFILPLLSKFFNFRIWLLLHFLIIFFIPPTPTYFCFSYGSCLPVSPDICFLNRNFGFVQFFRNLSLLYRVIDSFLSLLLF